MILKKFVPLVLIAFSFISTASSQVNTNIAGLRATSVRAENLHRELSSRLTSLARQNGWPLILKMKGGNQAVLYGISNKGFPLYVATTNNIISAATIGTNQLWPGGSTGLNLSGSTDTMKGRIAIWDGGKVLGTHQELNGRVVQVDNSPTLNDHSTHVSGTLIAAGVNPVAKGMSFGAKQLQAYDFDNDVAEMSAAASGLLISNHSYGTIAGWNLSDTTWQWLGNPGDSVDYKFGYYDDQSRDWDSIAYDAPNYLIVKSVGNNRDVNGPAVGQPYEAYNSKGVLAPAGNRPPGISNNDGYDIIPTYGTAKNIIAIGAVNPIPGGYNTPADVQLADFSSWGPTDDGRIKPDLVADGINVLSSISTSNNAYAIYSGTSMSSPAAAGSGFLLQEYYLRLHKTFMRSATLKGILIHTADEAGVANGPDYQFGYGLIDMVKAASVITSNNTDQLIQENVLTDAVGTYSIPVVASGKGPLTVTICWTDPAGTVDEVNVLNNHTSKLVNDLDLRVTGNGTTYMPWILSRLNPAAPATNGDDTVNNVEKIVIPNTIPGKSYTITVTHKRTLHSGAQAYSLIVSNVGSSPYCASAPTSSAGTRIDEVSIANVDQVNPAGCTTYTDNTSHTINLQSGQTIPFTIKLSTCDATNASRIVKIFVDINNSGTFSDSGEILVSPVLPGGVYSYTGNLTIPQATIGSITRMRIIAEETTDSNAVLPCGTYGKGETQDFTVTFLGLSNDAGVSDIVDPLPGTCQADSQRISVRIKNYGTSTQSNIPVHLKVLSGNNTLVDINTVYPDSINALGSAIYTFQTPYKTVAGSTYIVQASTTLPGDQNISNNGISDTLAVSAGSEVITGEAEICSSNPASAGLRANVSDSSDAVLWFDSPTATTPIASGIQANTTVIPANNTYYLGLNEMTGSIGPKTKLAYSNGGYNYFQGNFIKFHNDVPITIETARLYIGAGGKVNFIVADLADYDSCTGAFSYFPITTNTIDVYPTTPNPSRVASSVNSPLDTGAVFLLNLAVPTPGDHVIIVIAQDSAFLFRNNGLTSNPYPVGIPGVFTITGNSAINTTNCADSTFFQGYYYFFYDMKITLNKCPSPRVAVQAKTPAPAVITRIGNLLSSNYATGNQWYYNDTLQIGATKQTDSLKGPGSYKVVVNDSVGCSLVSNVYVYTPGNDIGLVVSPNPSNGIFNVQFYSTTASNTDLRVLDINGQQIYESHYPNFKGAFSSSINLGVVSAGMYVLQLQVGSKKYIQKVMVY